MLKNAKGEPSPSKSSAGDRAGRDGVRSQAYIEALKTLGITATLNKVDDAQYKR